MGPAPGQPNFPQVLRVFSFPVASAGDTIEHMFTATARPRYGSSSRGAGRHVSVARERGAGYDAGGAEPQAQAGAQPDAAAPRSPAAEAIAQLDAALEALAQVDWQRESADAVRAASVKLQRRVNRLTAESLRPVEQLEARQAYRFDGAVSAASWLRNRTNMDPATAARLCTAARRLRRLPLLRSAFAAGEVSLAHVTAVTEAAVPNRFDAIASMESTLVELASTAKPHAVRTALRAIADAVDKDGSDPDPEMDLDPEPAPADEHDARRYWRQAPTLDGLVAGEYLIDGVFAEMLTTLFDAISTADPADTPLRHRRSPAQKRVDALRAAVLAMLNAGLAPTVQGNKAHLLLMVDLLTLMGRDSAAVFASELRRTGRVSPATVARLGLDAKITPVLTMGPWRVVAVGRTHRTLPAWLRPMMEMIHRRCRGPDCGRPACWAEAHHEQPFAAGGDTDLNATIPLCPAHHDLVTTKGWTVTLDLDTGICTWTAPDGRTIQTHPER